MGTGPYPPFRLEGIQSTKVGRNDFKMDKGRRIAPSRLWSQKR